MISDHTDVKSTIALFEIWIRARMAYLGSPGVAVAIVHGQETVYAKGIGVANLDSATPITPETIFRMASHSKLFTTIAVMQLCEQGKLQLDHPISKYLPWFCIQNGAPEATPITIRHLLTHASGLPRETEAGYWTEYSFPGLDDVKTKLLELEAIYPPETRHKYSNLAFVLAGEIVATVSGVSCVRYIQDHIMKPLQMTSSSVEFYEAQQKHLATGYGRRFPDGIREVIEFIDAKALAAAAGVSSTLTDMSRFMAWQFRLLQGERDEVLRPDTLLEMQRVHRKHPEGKSAWGIGFGIRHHAKRDLVGHSGRYPGYLTSTWISPVEKIGVTVLTNAMDLIPEAIRDKAFEWIAPAITKAATGIPGLKPDPQWSSYEGTYRTIWADTHIMPVEGKLIKFDPTADDPKASARILEPVREHTFRITGEATANDSIGEEVVFKLDGSGQAQSVLLAGSLAKRVAY